MRKPWRLPSAPSRRIPGRPLADPSSVKPGTFRWAFRWRLPTSSVCTFRCTFRRLLRRLPANSARASRRAFLRAFQRRIPMPSAARTCPEKTLPLAAPETACHKPRTRSAGEPSPVDTAVGGDRDSVVAPGDDLHDVHACQRLHLRRCAAAWPAQLPARFQWRAAAAAAALRSTGRRHGAHIGTCDAMECAAQQYRQILLDVAPCLFQGRPHPCFLLGMRGPTSPPDIQKLAACWLSTQ
eukprot:34838-Chlamydomonas_euryale.AAC.3